MVVKHVLIYTIVILIYILILNTEGRKEKRHLKCGVIQRYIKLIFMIKMKERGVRRNNRCERL